jgi:peptidoglycan/LPS O-acetylase OafA/YrhL
MTIRNEGSADSHAIRYRPEVDGLRAIAVLSVVCYHLLNDWLPGGYLGVDMFFVISGFLITAIIWKEMGNGEFSVARFYDRRIRRIMPALLLLLFVTTIVSLILLLPTDLVGFGKSLAATLGFSANIYFWRDTNYFAPAAAQKPLLHLWSLGVEEQFYVLFPLLLLVLARRWPDRSLYPILILTIGSLAANTLAILRDAASPAFFLLPTRAWELGLGAVLALLPSHVAPRGRLAELAATVGALAILGAIFHPITTYWFAPVALLPVIGTAFVILAGKNDNPFVSRLLRLRPVVFVGLISYSLYLWHWPIIVLGQYYLVRAFTYIEVALSLGLMIVCATASWWFVERPLRSKAIPIHKVRIGAGIGVGLLIIASAAIIETRGFPGRLNAAASKINEAVDTNYRCPVADYLAFGASRACIMNLPSRKPMDADVILLGNSHAQMYAPVWTSILEMRGLSGLLVPANGCLPTVTANLSQQCINIALLNLSVVSKLSRASVVIIGLNWNRDEDTWVDSQGKPISNANNESFEAALDDLIDRLRRMGKRVVLIGPIAEPGWDVASTLSRQLAFGHQMDRPLFLTRMDFEQHYGPLIEHFETARPGFSFARPDKVQCPADRCYYLLGGHSLFSDSNHLAVAELGRFRAVFEASLSEVSAGGG